VKQLRLFIRSLRNHKYNRALEVACGQGLLTKDLLSKLYKYIDMFDQCSKAIEEAEANTIEALNILGTE